MKWIAPIFLALLIISGCKSKPKERVDLDKEQEVLAYRKNVKNTASLTIFDQYGRDFRKSYGSMMSGNIIVAPLDAVQGSYSVKAKYLGHDIEPIMSGYMTYDFKTNLVFMRVSGGLQYHAPLAEKLTGTSFYSLHLIDGKLQKLSHQVTGALTNDSVDFVTLNTVAKPGTSLFNPKHQLVGIFTQIKVADKDTVVVVPIEKLLQLFPTPDTEKHSISNLRLKTGKIYPKPSTIAGFKVETSMGNFTFKIYDDLSEYKQNMIKLVDDQYYDSLLIHRVLYKFLIQTGAADTKYAKKGDPVGWRGPGYMQPTIIKPQYVHKRGAIALSKPPSYKNPKNKSSGAQFYVISGRTFSDEELDEYEKLKNFKYSGSQRNTYKTIGGAAYLDSEYAVIGEVLSGMDVVDRIASVPVDDDERPLGDIRIKKVSLIKK